MEVISPFYVFQVKKILAQSVFREIQYRELREMFAFLHLSHFLCQNPHLYMHSFPTRAVFINNAD